MAWYRYRTSRKTENGEVSGVLLPAVIHNGDHYLTLLGIYCDGMVDCWGLVTLDEFIAKVRDGWVTNTVPPGSTLGIHHLVNLTVAASDSAGTVDDLIKDVRNAIEELNGRPTAQVRIIEAIKALIANYDDPEARAAFLSAHTDLPGYYRKYVFGSQMEKHKAIQLLLDSE